MASTGEPQYLLNAIEGFYREHSFLEDGAVSCSLFDKIALREAELSARDSGLESLHSNEHAAICRVRKQLLLTGAREETYTGTSESYVETACSFTISAHDQDLCESLSGVAQGTPLDSRLRALFSSQHVEREGRPAGRDSVEEACSVDPFGDSRGVLVRCSYARALKLWGQATMLGVRDNSTLARVRQLRGRVGITGSGHYNEKKRYLELVSEGRQRLSLLLQVERLLLLARALIPQKDSRKRLGTWLSIMLVGHDLARMCAGNTEEPLTLTHCMLCQQTRGKIVPVKLMLRDMFTGRHLINENSKDSKFGFNSDASEWTPLDDHELTSAYQLLDETTLKLSASLVCERCSNGLEDSEITRRVRNSIERVGCTDAVRKLDDAELAVLQSTDVYYQAAASSYFSIAIHNEKDKTSMLDEPSAFKLFMDFRRILLSKVSATDLVNNAETANPSMFVMVPCLEPRDDQSVFFHRTFYGPYNACFGKSTTIPYHNPKLPIRKGSAYTRNTLQNDTPLTGTLVEDKWLLVTIGMFHVVVAIQGTVEQWLKRVALCVNAPGGVVTRPRGHSRKKSVSKMDLASSCAQPLEFNLYPRQVLRCSQELAMSRAQGAKSDTLLQGEQRVYLRERVLAEKASGRRQLFGVFIDGLDGLDVSGVEVDVTEDEELQPCALQEYVSPYTVQGGEGVKIIIHGRSASLFSSATSQDENTITITPPPPPYPTYRPPAAPVAADPVSKDGGMMVELGDRLREREESTTNRPEQSSSVYSDDNRPPVPSLPLVPPPPLFEGDGEEPITPQTELMSPSRSAAPSVDSWASKSRKAPGHLNIAMVEESVSRKTSVAASAASGSLPPVVPPPPPTPPSTPMILNVLSEHIDSESEARGQPTSDAKSVSTAPVAPPKPHSLVQKVKSRTGSPSPSPTPPAMSPFGDSPVPPPKPVGLSPTPPPKPANIGPAPPPKPSGMTAQKSSESGPVPPPKPASLKGVSERDAKTVLSAVPAAVVESPEPKTPSKSTQGKHPLQEANGSPGGSPQAASSGTAGKKKNKKNKKKGAKGGGPGSVPSSSPQSSPQRSPASSPMRQSPVQSANAVRRLPQVHHAGLAGAVMSVSSPRSPHSPRLFGAYNPALTQLAEAAATIANKDAKVLRPVGDGSGSPQGLAILSPRARPHSGPTNREDAPALDLAAASAPAARVMQEEDGDRLSGDVNSLLEFWEKRSGVRM